MSGKPVMAGARDKALLTSSGDDVKDRVCFTTEIQPIINSNYAKIGCHDPVTVEEGYDFSSCFGIMEIVKTGKPENSELMEAITGDGEDSMPPSPIAALNAGLTGMICQ